MRKACIIKQALTRGARQFEVTLRALYAKHATDHAFAMRGKFKWLAVSVAVLLATGAVVCFIGPRRNPNLSQRLPDGSRLTIVAAVCGTNVDYTISLQDPSRWRRKLHRYIQWLPWVGLPVPRIIPGGAVPRVLADPGTVTVSSSMDQMSFSLGGETSLVVVATWEGPSGGVGFVGNSRLVVCNEKGDELGHGQRSSWSGMSDTKRRWDIAGWTFEDSAFSRTKTTIPPIHDSTESTNFILRFQTLAPDGIHYQAVAEFSLRASDLRAGSR